jgi:hypothetical protein
LCASAQLPAQGFKSVMVDRDSARHGRIVALAKGHPGRVGLGHVDQDFADGSTFDSLVSGGGFLE